MPPTLYGELFSLALDTSMARHGAPLCERNILFMLVAPDNL